VKIAFLCTSLAPGRDGVGDYVRQLATACVEAGHECLLIALHDRHLSAATSSIQRTNEVRFSATQSWASRAILLAELLKKFDPNWVSWQMVPYGFHPKGIIPAGVFQLVEAARPWTSHVMLHEVWVGLAKADNIPLRLVGAWQRRRLLAFLHQLKPACLHTSNEAYQLVLAQQGWQSDLLPLFGNMPVLAVSPAVARTELSALLGSSVQFENLCLGVIFGTIHPQWKPQPTLEWLEASARQLRRPIGLLAVGRVGQHGTDMFARLSAEQNILPLFVAGPQTPERVSLLLQAADFGIATHPWALIEKSGSTATLLEHGLPVVVPRDDWQLRVGSLTGTRDPLLRRLDDLQPVEFGRWSSQRREPRSLLPMVADKFITRLSQPSPRGAIAA
jgi:hypothetical protein